MRVRFLSSLPARLAAALLVLSGLLLVALTEIRGRAVERILSDQAEIQAEMATSAVADGLAGAMNPVEHTVQLVARYAEGTDLSRARMEAAARNALVFMPSVFGVSVAVDLGPAARFGVAVERSNAPSRFQTRDLTAGARPFWEQDWYRETRDKGAAVWSEPYFDRGGCDRNVVRVSAPLFQHHGDATPCGVVSAVIELDWLRHLANANEFSDSSHVIVFSRGGRLILHPKPTFVIAETMQTLGEKAGAPELGQIRQKVAAHRQGMLVYQDALTHRRIHVNYQPAKVAAWGVVVAYDEAEFLKPQREFRRIALMYLGITLVVLGVIVIVVTARALRPLKPLSAAAGEIARGNLDVDVPAAVRADEVGQMTTAFRAMRDGLKAQQLQNRWAAQSLEHQLRYNQLIIDSMGELVFVLTKALNISRINPAVTRVTGFTAPDLVKAPLARLVRDVAGNDSTTEALAAAMQAQSVVERRPVTVATHDGREVAGRLTFAPLVDSNRVVGGVVTIRIDLDAGPA